MRKSLIFIALFIVLLALAALISLRFFPKLYVTAFNKYSPQYQLSTEQLNVQFFPLSLSVKALGVKNVDGSTLLTLDEANATAQLVGWLRDKNNFWKADFSQIDFKLYNLPAATEGGQSNAEAEKVIKLNVHQTLSGFSLNVEDLLVQLDEQQSVRVVQLKTSLNDHDLFDFTEVEQDITFSLVYKNQLISENNELALNGRISSVHQAGVSVVDINIPVIDLSMFDPIQAKSTTDQASKVEAEVVIEEVEEEIGNAVESVIDWQWMELFDPVQVNVDIQQAMWSKSSVENIELGLSLNKVIEFSLDSSVAWLESDGFSFNDTVKLKGQWQPTAIKSQGVDLTGELALSTSVTQVSVNGDVNLNGLNANKLSVVVQSTALPVNLDLDQFELLSIKQYFPIKTTFNIEQLDQTLKLDIQEAILGKSDLSGVVRLDSMADGGFDIKAQIESTLLSYQSVEPSSEEKVERNLQPLPEVAEGDVPQTPLVEDQLSGDKVFSDKAIDWSWLNSFLISFDLNVQQVLFDEIQISDLRLPIRVADGKLDMSGLSGGLGGGVFSSNASLVKREDVVDVTLELDAADIVLEQLKLLPPDELKKAITNMTVKLKASGQSASQLAQSLDGTLHLLVGDGVIGNNSFELIGSDLILGLLNKLNPFAKKDKTTDLECAVVNLNIENGKVDVNKSIALRTSKLTMVADGLIDLSTEKIKLNLTPKARQGIGVDVSSLVKFVALGGTLSKPSPTVTTSGVLKSAVVVGAAVSTGGVSLLATSAAEKTIANVDVCERADNAFK